MAKPLIDSALLNARTLVADVVSGGAARKPLQPTAMVTRATMTTGRFEPLPLIA